MMRSAPIKALTSSITLAKFSWSFVKMGAITAAIKGPRYNKKDALAKDSILMAFT
jgi:hypothetical protein